MQSTALNMARCTRVAARKVISAGTVGTGPGWIALTAISSQSVITLADVESGIAANAKASRGTVFIDTPCCREDDVTLRQGSRLSQAECVILRPIKLSRFVPEGAVKL